MDGYTIASFLPHQRRQRGWTETRADGYGHISDAEMRQYGFEPAEAPNKEKQDKCPQYKGWYTATKYKCVTCSNQGSSCTIPALSVIGNIRGPLLQRKGCKECSSRGVTCDSSTYNRPWCWAVDDEGNIFKASAEFREEVNARLARVDSTKVDLPGATPQRKPSGDPPSVLSRIINRGDQRLATAQTQVVVLKQQLEVAMARIQELEAKTEALEELEGERQHAVVRLTHKLAQSEDRLTMAQGRVYSLKDDLAQTNLRNRVLEDRVKAQSFAGQALKDVVNRPIWVEGDAEERKRPRKRTRSMAYL